LKYRKIFAFLGAALMRGGAYFEIANFRFRKIFVSGISGADFMLFPIRRQTASLL